MAVFFLHPVVHPRHTVLKIDKFILYKAHSKFFQSIVIPPSTSLAIYSFPSFYSSPSRTHCHDHRLLSIAFPLVVSLAPHTGPINDTSSVGHSPGTSRQNLKWEHWMTSFHVDSQSWINLAVRREKFHQPYYYYNYSLNDHYTCS